MGFGGMERGANWGGPIHMRQMAGDPIETAHEPKANESHKMSGAINYSPQANQDTLDNLIWTTLGRKYGHHRACPRGGLFSPAVRSASRC